MSQQDENMTLTIQQMMAQMTAMQAELAELKARSILQPHSPQQLPALSNNYPPEVIKPSLTKTNRRKMLKAECFWRD